MENDVSLTVKILSIVGLFCDLVAAFLLSIPMVWSSQKAGETFTMIASRMRPTTSIRNLDNVIILAFAFSPVFFHSFVPVDLLDTPGAITVEYASYVLMTYVLVVVLLKGLSEVLPWLGSGNRDRRIGAVGLVLLGVGYILQFVVNLKWVA
jgi:hypothetical protein